MKRYRFISISLLFALIVSSCGSEAVKSLEYTSTSGSALTDVDPEIESEDGEAFVLPAEYISISGSAPAGMETKIELEDGAAIVLPANSLTQDAKVTIERNPTKIEFLPPLEEDVIQISDFYNFEIEEADLIDGVDLVLPFDETRIPDEEGLLTVAIPIENGWEYVPVTNNGGKVTYYTANLGDPIIAWHFVQTIENDKTVCDPYIHLDISPESGSKGAEIQITGQVLPLREGIPGWLEKWGQTGNTKPATNIPVIVTVGSNFLNDNYGSLSLTTDENGAFSGSYTTGDELGGVFITVKAQCEKWFGRIPVPSEGRAYFRVVPSEEGNNPIEEPATQSEEEIQEMVEIIPDGAIKLPDFVGKTMEDAITWLTENGFRYNWVDGSSTYEVGQIYNQKPGGGKFYVPHRTTVVIYRTIYQEEKIEYPLDLVYKGTNKNTICQCAGKCNSMEYSFHVTLFEDGSIEGSKGTCKFKGTSGALEVDCADNSSPGYSKTKHEYYISADYKVITSTSWQDSDYGVCAYEGTYYLQE